MTMDKLLQRIVKEETNKLLREVNDPKIWALLEKIVSAVGPEEVLKSVILALPSKDVGAILAHVIRSTDAQIDERDYGLGEPMQIIKGQPIQAGQRRATKEELVRVMKALVTTGNFGGKQDIISKLSIALQNSQSNEPEITLEGK